MQTIKVSEDCLKLWEIDHIDDNEQQQKKSLWENQNYKLFILPWAKPSKTSSFLLTLEGAKSSKRSDHDGNAQKQTLHQICKGSHKHEISPTNTKLDVAEMSCYYVWKYMLFLFDCQYFTYMQTLSWKCLEITSGLYAIFHLKTFKCFQNFYYFLLWRKRMWVIMCHTSRQSKELGAEKKL